jgi:hypothetical protein
MATSASAARIAAALASGDKAQRATAYTELSALGVGDEALAVASVGALFDHAIGAGVEAVDTADFRRACLVVNHLWRLSPLPAAVEMTRGLRFGLCGHAAPTTHAIMDKEPAQITRDDALTFAHWGCWFVAWHCSGVDDALEGAGVSWEEFLSTLPKLRFFVPGAVHEGFRERVTLALDVNVIDLDAAPYHILYG